MSIKSLNHKLTFISLISVLGLLIISCKKEDDYIGTSQDITMHHLTGDTAVMVGKWNWVYSDHQFNICDPPLQYETVTPSTEETDFSIYFIKEGIVYFYKNNALIAEYRTVFRDFSNTSNWCGPGSSKSFIYLDSLENKTFSSCISNDTMRAGFNGFIFQSEPGCESYINYFIRE